MGEKEVLYQLLGNGAGAFLDFSVLQVHQGGPGNAFEVHSVMCIEAVVFYRQHGLLQVFREVLEAHIVFSVKPCFHSPV